MGVRGKLHGFLQPRQALRWRSLRPQAQALSIIFIKERDLQLRCGWLIHRVVAIIPEDVQYRRCRADAPRGA